MPTTEPSYTGPRIGDTVLVEIPVYGTVVAMQSRDGVPGVEINTGTGTVWFALDAVVLMRRVAP